MGFLNVEVINMLPLANFVTQRTGRSALLTSEVSLDSFIFFTVAAIAAYVKWDTKGDTIAIKMVFST